MAVAGGETGALGGVSTVSSGVEIDGGGEGSEVMVAVAGGMAVRGSAVSVVRSPRSLMVSFCGLVVCSKSGISSCV
jgi:hypothetical protein